MLYRTFQVDIYQKIRYTDFAEYTAIYSITKLNYQLNQGDFPQ